MKLFLFLLLPLIAAAQGVNLGLNCPPQSTPGAVVACNVVLTGATQPAAVDGVLNITTGTTPTPVVWTITSTLISKPVASAQGTSNIFVFAGMNQTVISNGTIGAVNFIMPSGNVTYSISAGSASDPSGGVIAVAVNPPTTIVVQSKCDENSDGVVNAADWNIAIQNILSGAPTVAALGTNLSNAQKDANAITGTCTR